jgi:ATP-binding cassette subfamily C protein LapB
VPDASVSTSTAAWRAHPARAEVDPLAECLAILTRRENRPTSPESLCAGLPLESGRLTPDLFVRAAERAGFSARVVRRPLADVSTLVLPAVLLLNHRDACVLTAMPDPDRCTVVQPEAPDSDTTLRRVELEQAYSGYAIFVRPLARTPRHPASAAPALAGTGSGTRSGKPARSTWKSWLPAC